MRGYREVYKPTDGAKPDPGRIFYTIRADDVGLGTLKTDEGPIHVAGFMGRVQAIDVGKRVYRVPVSARPDDYRVKAGKLTAGEPADWIWQVENNEQRDERLARRRTGS